MGTMLVSFSKDGLICASPSRLTKQELAIAVITATDSSSSCAHRGGDGDAVTVRAVARAAGSRCLRISVATLFLLFSRMATAGPLEDANSAYDKGDFGIARNLYSELAVQGDRTAQFKLGEIYEEGKGVAKDSREAVRWYVVASSQGFAEAAFNLGRLYHDGRGVPQNFARAREWYLIATRRGVIKAAANLGFMNASGEGGRPDYRQAIRWFVFAAQRGDNLAKCNLGTMYFNGQGVPRDLVRAHMWYNLAAAHGDPEAIRNRDSVAHLMTANQITRAQEMATERQMYVP
jgi:TPR repeat protein